MMKLIFFNYEKVDKIEYGKLMSNQIEGSFNGRTTGSGPVNLGSNPSPSEYKRPGGGIW